MARALGVNHETLRNWMAEARRHRAAGPAALSSDERLEPARPPHWVAELEVNRESLEKAAVFNA